MTRINCVPVEELHPQHLGAEYYELPRIVSLVKAAIQRGEQPDDRRNPKEYTLGAGHVRFFYNKMTYIERRFAAVVAECQRRGRKIQFTELPSCDFPASWRQDWTPTQQALAINRSRIQERLNKMKPQTLMEQLAAAAAAAQPIEKKKEPTPRKKIVRVRATGAGLSALQPSSVRAKILAHIAAQPNKSATVEELDAAFNTSTRGHLQKLIEKQHLEHA